MSEVNCRCNIATGVYVIGCPEHPAFLPRVEDLLPAARERAAVTDFDLPGAVEPAVVQPVVQPVMPGGESAADQLRRVEHERGELACLLEYALHLRQHGERAPGGDETWAEFDRRAELLLRGIDTAYRPKRHLDAVRSQLRRVEQELAGVRELLAQAQSRAARLGDIALQRRMERNNAWRERDAVLNDRKAVLAERNEARTAAEALRLQLDLARAEATSARYELAQVLERYSGWIVARDGGRNCAGCGREIRRGEAYTNDVTGDVQTHVHCRDD